MLLYLYILHLGVLDVLGVGGIDEAWGECYTIATHACNEAYLLAIAVLKLLLKLLLVEELPTKDALLLAYSSNYKPFLIYVVCVARFYIIELDFVAQNGEVSLVLFAGISGVTIAVY